MASSLILEMSTMSSTPLTFLVVLLCQWYGCVDQKQKKKKRRKAKEKKSKRMRMTTKLTLERLMMAGCGWGTVAMAGVVAGPPGTPAGTPLAADAAVTKPSRTV